MKVLLCCIVKMENHYLEEWVRHYINLGIDKIVIYDNNDIKGEYVEKIEDIPFINKQIKNEFIDVYKIPNEVCVQLKYYNECYAKYNNFDWLLFLDIDEYLILENFINIKEFLSQDKFNNYDIIHLNWKTFTDNNLLRVENNNYSLVKRFTTPCKNLVCLNKTVDSEIKSIVRGGIPYLEFLNNPHTMDSIKIPCCDSLGNEADNQEQKSEKIIHKEAWINHYICKTIEEYCNNKLIRMGGHTKHISNLRYNKNFFFKYNMKTDEKIKIFNNFNNENGMNTNYSYNYKYSTKQTKSNHIKKITVLKSAITK